MFVRRFFYEQRFFYGLRFLWTTVFLRFFLRTSGFFTHYGFFHVLRSSVPQPEFSFRISESPIGTPPPLQHVFNPPSFDDDCDMAQRPPLANLSSNRRPKQELSPAMRQEIYGHVLAGKSRRSISRSKSIPLTTVSTNYG